MRSGGWGGKPASPWEDWLRSFPCSVLSVCLSVCPSLCRSRLLVTPPPALHFINHHTATLSFSSSPSPSATPHHNVRLSSPVLDRLTAPLIPPLPHKQPHLTNNRSTHRTITIVTQFSSNAAMLPSPHCPLLALVPCVPILPTSLARSTCRCQLTQNYRLHPPESRLCDPMDPSGTIYTVVETQQRLMFFFSTVCSLLRLRSAAYCVCACCDRRRHSGAVVCTRSCILFCF